MGPLFSCRQLAGEKVNAIAGQKCSRLSMSRSVRGTIAVAEGVLVCVFLFFIPVPFFIVTDANGLLLACPVLPEQFITTRYIHSVERTPVEDSYSIRGTHLWQWEERVKSHNAGLPVAPSRNGRFLTRDEWFVFQGGRARFSVIYYRVGNERFGVNELLLPPSTVVKLYEKVPGERLSFSVEPSPLARSTGSILSFGHQRKKSS